KEHGVAGVQRQAEPVLLRRRRRVARAAHPAVGRQRVRGGRRVVRLDLRRRGPALHPQVQLVRPFRRGAGGEVVDLQEVGPRGGDRGARDRRGQTGEAAVVVVELDGRRAVGGDQRELAVGAAAGGERG